jgi:hypothetical protein
MRGTALGRAEICSGMLRPGHLVRLRGGCPYDVRDAEPGCQQAPQSRSLGDGQQPDDAEADDDCKADGKEVSGQLPCARLSQVPPGRITSTSCR